MEPGSIVVDLNVVEHERTSRIASGQALPVDGFDFEAVVPTLHRRVVVAVALGCV